MLKQATTSASSVHSPVPIQTKLLWSHITDEEVLVGYDGECTAGLILQGFSYYGSSNETLDHAVTTLSQRILRALPSGITVTFVEMRLPIVPQLPTVLASHAFATEVQAIHRAHLEKMPLFTQQTVLLLVANPFTDLQQSQLRTGCGDRAKWHPARWFKATPPIPHDYTEVLTDTIAELVRVRAQLKAHCAAFSPRTLTRQGPLTWYHLLSLPVNGLMAVQPHGTPKEQLAHFMATCDVSVDDRRGTLEFARPDNTRTYGAVLSEVAINAQHTSLERLVGRLTLPFSYYRVVTYTPWSRSQSQKTLKRQLEELIAAGDMSVNAQQGIQAAHGEVDDNALLLGNYTASHLVVAPTETILDERIRKMQAVYHEADMPLRRETDCLLTLWLSMMVGHRHRAKRVIRGLTNHNIADIVFPFHDNTGHRNSHLGEAVTVFPTLHRAPYYFNWHLPGKATIDVQGGATLVVGAVGSGKNVFVTKCLCDTARFGGKTLLLDYRKASYVFTAANDGEYITLDLSGTVGFAPLHYDDGDAVIEIMCLEEGETELPTAIANQLSQSIRDLKTTEAKSETHLTRLVEKYLPPDFPRHDNLARFLPDGKYGALFNSDSDTLTFEKALTAIDLTFLINPDNKIPFAVKGAVLQHITSRMNAVKRHLKGALFTLVIDEFFNYLKDSYWQNRIEDIFATWRKDNGYPILLQQDVATLAASPIAGAIKTNLATTVCFANPQAEAADYAAIGLEAFETENVKKLAIMGRYMVLVKQKNHGSEIINIDATYLARYLPALSSNQYLAARCKLLQKKYGDAYSKWYEAYLDEVTVLSDSVERLS